jgi:hypothetical protein
MGRRRSGHLGSCGSTVNAALTLDLTPPPNLRCLADYAIRVLFG